jgi:ribonuclease HII
MLKLGIDDAGRGPVIGPMITAGVILDSKAEKELKKLGVRDSKELTQKRREFLEQKIKDLAKGYKVEVISPTEIDDSINSGTNLNEVEAIHMAEIVNKLNSGQEKIQLIVDCPSISIAKWSEMFRMKIHNLSNLDVCCEHKADQNHVSVSAASILAKTERERHVEKLKEKYGKEIGSGYPSDSVTIKFLQKNILKYNNDGIFRKTWSTWKNAFENSGQKKLEF